MGVERKGRLDGQFVDRARERWIESATTVIHSRAVANAPVRTGNLKGSLDREAGPEEGIVFTPVHYAPHVEYGTIHMEAHPFLRPALDVSKTELMNLFVRYLREEV